jgi:hypothetical protein
VRHLQTEIADRVLRATAIALLIAGAAVGLNRALGIVLIALGLLVVIAISLSNRHRPPGPAH